MWLSCSRRAITVITRVALTYKSSDTHIADNMSKARWGDDSHRWRHEWFDCSFKYGCWEWMWVWMRVRMWVRMWVHLWESLSCLAVKRKLTWLEASPGDRMTDKFSLFFLRSHERLSCKALELRTQVWRPGPNLNYKTNSILPRPAAWRL